MNRCQELIHSLNRRKMNDTAIGDACGVSRVYINYVKNGKRHASQELQDRLETLYAQTEPKKQHTQRPLPGKPLGSSTLPRQAPDRNVNASLVQTQENPPCKECKEPGYIHVPEQSGKHYWLCLKHYLEASNHGLV